MTQLRTSPVIRKLNAVWQRIPNSQQIQEVSAD